MTLASRAGAFLALLFMGQVKPRQGRSHCKEAESGENTPASPRASQDHGALESLTIPRAAEPLILCCFFPTDKQCKSGPCRLDNSAMGQGPLSAVWSLLLLLWFLVGEAFPESPGLL